MNLTNNHGDGLKANNCTSIKFYDNKAYLLGHDVLYASKCQDVEAYNNKITCRTNSGLRIYNTNQVSFYNNNITSEGYGGAGIEIQKEGSNYIMNKIEVYNNTIYRTVLAGIWIFGSGSYSNSSANVSVHHNRIYDTGNFSRINIGGIISDGFNVRVENNVIDGAYGAGVAQKNVYSSSTLDGSGFVLTARNNIITNIRPSSNGGNGSGVLNLLTDTHSFVLQNNCFYNNSGGGYSGVDAGLGDIQADPQYADRNNHDYHLKSKAGRWNGSNWVNDSVSSPCIDAGYPLSDYSKEPEPNGNRINIGVYGNTEYASKSEFENLVFPGYINPPTDPDHDGSYEDINGNGKVDFDDVVAYYANMDWIEENASVTLFDYNNNNIIDFDDVVKLYNLL
jgi:PKD repeat protein